MDDDKARRASVSSEQLNFILAVCAILISAASFYAVYLQANSAERQVNAMTLPLIQFSHGDYDTERDTRSIYFSLENAGVGPAIINSVTRTGWSALVTGFQSLWWRSSFPAKPNTPFRRWTTPASQPFVGKIERRALATHAEHLLLHYAGSVLSH